MFPEVGGMVTITGVGLSLGVEYRNVADAGVPLRIRGNWNSGWVERERSESYRSSCSRSRDRIFCRHCQPGEGDLFHGRSGEANGESGGGTLGDCIEHWHIWRCRNHWFRRKSSASKAHDDGRLPFCNFCKASLLGAEGKCSFYVHVSKERCKSVDSEWSKKFQCSTNHKIICGESGSRAHGNVSGNIQVSLNFEETSDS